MKLYICAVLLVTGALGDYLDSIDVAPTASTTCSCGWVNRNRIVGGQETQVGYPMVAALWDVRYGFYCGGTILTPWHVVTAAHCTQRPAKFIRVLVGSHDITGKTGTAYKINRTIDHPLYDDDIMIYDISILVTSTKMVFNQQVGPACLPNQRLSLTGQKIKATGWGLTTDGGTAPSTVMQEVDLTVINTTTCQKLLIPRGGHPRTEDNICTYELKKDTCQGDSGGPLFWLEPRINKYLLAALVSYGGICGGDLPSVNTDVSAFIRWINDTITSSKPGEQQACSLIT